MCGGGNERGYLRVVGMWWGDGISTGGRVGDVRGMSIGGNCNQMQGGGGVR